MFMAAKNSKLLKDGGGLEGHRKSLTNNDPEICLATSLELFVYIRGP